MSEDKGYTLVQFDDEVFENENAKAHGNFRVGQIKESEIVNLHKIESPNEIEQLIEDFLSSGSRIEVLQTPETMPVQELRDMISSKLLHLTQFGSSYRRVIVREYDNVLYLARRAFWDGKRLPIIYSDELPLESEIGSKVRSQNEKVREIKTSLEHMSVLTPEQEQEIKEWEENENVVEITQLVSKMMKHAFA
jgi:hypothetical protein